MEPTVRSDTASTTTSDAVQPLPGEVFPKGEGLERRLHALDMPAGCVDCHVHLFDPARFAYSSARRYTAPPAPLDALSDHLSRIGMPRVVLVQPSVYGTDNSCMLDGLSRLGKAARGVAVVDVGMPANELADMFDRGVRAIRLNYEVVKERDPATAINEFLRAQDQVGPHRMFLQINASLGLIAALGPYVQQAQVPVLFDHYGLAQAALGPVQPGFSVLVDLLKARKAYVKLSGPYQISSQAPAYADIRPLAAALVDAEPHQLVWGSDWPHTGGAARNAAAAVSDEEPFRKVDDVGMLNLLREWVPDAIARQEILATNAIDLFGF